MGWCLSLLHPLVIAWRVWDWGGSTRKRARDVWPGGSSPASVAVGESTHLAGVGSLWDNITCWTTATTETNSRTLHCTWGPILFCLPEKKRKIYTLRVFHGSGEIFSSWRVFSVPRCSQTLVLKQGLHRHQFVNPQLLVLQHHPWYLDEWIFFPKIRILRVNKQTSKQKQNQNKHTHTNQIKPKPNKPNPKPNKQTKR